MLVVRNSPKVRLPLNFLLDRTVAKDAPTIADALRLDAFESVQAHPPATGGEHSAAPTQTFTPHPEYYGGKVLQTPVIYNIYLGDYWKQGTGADDKKHNDGFAEQFGKSTMKDLLGQYGAGATTYGGSTIINGNFTHITNTEAQKVVKDAIAAQKVKKNAEGIYQVILPPGCVGEFDGMTLPDGNPADTKHGIGGWHMSYIGDDGEPVYYDLISYGDRSNGIDFSGVGRDNLSIVESHEIFEAITDPDVNSAQSSTRRMGWYDFNTVPLFNAQWAEISDITMINAQLGGIFGGGGNGLKDAYGMVDGYAMQKEWSNVDGKDELAALHPGPKSPLPPGKAYPDGVEVIAPPLNQAQK